MKMSKKQPKKEVKKQPRQRPKAVEPEESKRAKQQSEPTKAAEQKRAGGGEYLTAVKLRSAINASSKVKEILNRLGLRKRLTMVVLRKTPSMRGQLRLVKDFVTYGEIDRHFLDKVIDKRGREYKGRLRDSKKRVNYTRFMLYKGKRYKPYLGLHPPRGGFERGGLKKQFTQGGALGNRGKEIIKLIERML